MSPTSVLIRQWALGLSYFILAAGAVLFTRFEGGVAILWGASALLIAALIRTSWRNWWAPLLVCGVIGFLNTGFLGLGWKAAPIFLIANLGEAAFAAFWMKRDAKSGELMASLSWFGRYVVATTAGPLLLAPVAGLALWTIGGNPFAAIENFALGHALGNLALTPIAYMLTGRAARLETRRILKRRKRAALTLLPAVAIISFLTFWQTSWPLLFLPVMWVVFATFRLGRLGAAISLAMLTTIGGILTVRGLGPIALSGAAISERMQFFQFYLTATVLTVLPIAADLHHRRQLHRKLQRSEAEFRMLAEHCTDVIMRIAPDGRIKYASPAIAQSIGYEPDELVGQPSRMLIDPADWERVISAHRDTLAAAGGPRSYEYRVRTQAGEVRWFATNARALLDEDGIPSELLAIIRDVTVARASERQWAKAAMTDALTGLPNRRALEARVGDLEDGEHCVALFDIDRFKRVNDTYGHDVGDAVLHGFAEVAAKLVRTGDTLVRLGGEEFAVLFENTRIDQAFHICERLRAEVALTTLPTTAGSLTITVSGGVSPLSPGGLGPSLKAADQALYRAKSGGRDQLQLAA